ncbi:glycine zipper 2TM domain-containing protein [Stakelama marina]|uniref:17 kDa surface antigen n=1 Tax=Stakelama marina TaxID=2826939 RepID=A0A8T4IGL9_9SPHN|nr:glycine zipper 2TM domain-containing protein [Stakelama marina]MBR0553773.1 glycine zipper 2TM domain-containing protein [Stakelama marina]
MKKLAIMIGAAAMLPLGACSQYGLGGQPAYASNGYSSQYPASQYNYYTMGRNDTIYRGSDGRYYCKRDDGTTGAIVGGIGGGVLGNIIAPGGSKTLGTIIGAGAGAIIGQQVDKGDVKCATRR